MPQHRFKKLWNGVWNPFEGTVGYNQQFWGENIYAIQSDSEPTESVFAALDKTNATEVHTKMRLSRNYDTFCPAQCGIDPENNSTNPRIFYGGTASITNGERDYSFLRTSISGEQEGIFLYYLGGYMGQTAFNDIIAFRSTNNERDGYTTGDPILWRLSNDLTGYVFAYDLEIYLVYCTLDNNYYWCVRSILNDYYRYWLCEYGMNVYSVDDDNGEDDKGMIEFPEINIDFAINCGLTHAYKMTNEQVRHLASDLWNDNFWSQISHLFGDNPPYDAIINIGLLPYPSCIPNTTTENITIGTTEAPTAVGQPITTQVYHVDFEDIRIDPFYNNYFDYAPYTTVNVYLPFIGMITLPPEFVIGYTLSIRYYIDVISGACTCMIKNDEVGVFSVHNGSCMYSIPVSQAMGGHVLEGIANAVTGGINLSYGGALTSSSTDPVNFTDRTAIPVNMQSTVLNKNKTPTIAKTAGILTSAFNQNVVVRGAIGGNSGLTSFENEIPIVVTFPNVLDQSSYRPVVGKPVADYKRLSDLIGFTQVSDINLSGIVATKPEIEEIETMLKTGIIIPETPSQPATSSATAGRITVDMYSRIAPKNSVNYSGACSSVYMGTVGDFRTTDKPSITHPVIIVNKPITALSNVNYIYIKEFNRFYYVSEGMIALTAETTLIPLDVDVLNSFWSSISANEGYVTRSSDPRFTRIYMADDHAVIGSNIGLHSVTYSPRYLTSSGTIGSDHAAYVLLVAGE